MDSTKSLQTSSLIDPIEYLISNYKISRLINFSVSSRQYDGYFDLLHSIKDGKVDFNVFAKKLILYNYCLLVDDTFETRVFHAINKGFLTKKYSNIEKDIFSLISMPKFEIYVEVLDPILKFINFLIRYQPLIESTNLTELKNSTPSEYKEFIESLALNFHLFVKDSKFPIFNYLTNILEYFKSNKSNSNLIIPEYNFTLRMIIDIMEQHSYQKSNSLLTNILCATDQFCGVFCYYMSEAFKFEECKKTISLRIVSHLKSLQYTKISELYQYMIQIIKDVSHMIFHTNMTVQNYNQILKEFDFPDWMKDSITCNLASIPYYELKYMLGIPYSFTYDTKHEINTDFDRYFCYNIQDYNVKLFPNLISCLNCMEVDYNHDEKGSVEEEKEKAKKSSQLNKIILSRLPQPSVICSVIHGKLPDFKNWNTGSNNNSELLELKESETIKYQITKTEFSKYYDKRDFIVSKIQSHLLQHVNQSIELLKKETEIMKEKYLGLLKCRFINEEDTLYTSIYEWDPEYLIFENDGKDNLHVFTPAEYEQLYQKDMNFYNRQPLDLLNKFKISNSLKLYTYSKFPRLPILLDFKKYLTESTEINNSSTSSLFNWISTTYRDLHTRTISYHLTNTKSDFLPRISQGAHSFNNSFGSNPLTNSLLSANMLLRMLFDNDNHVD
jgi:hypothetical protein